MGGCQIPVDNLTAVNVLQSALKDCLPPETVLVSPDPGRIPMAMKLARKLNISMAVLHKQRQNGMETNVTHVIGDVKDKPCLLIDDMISTGGTIATSIDALLEANARSKIFIAATHHGLLIENARDNLNHHSIEGIFVTDTVAIEQSSPLQVQLVSVAPLIVHAIKKMLTDSN